MRQLHTFIVRILPEENSSGLHGQITQPSSADGWRASFSNATELWQKLTERMQLGARASSLEPPAGEAPA